MQNFFDVNAPTEQELNQLAGFIAGMEDFASSNNGSDYQRVSPVQQIKKQKWPLPNRSRTQTPKTVVDLSMDDQPESAQDTDSDVEVMDYLPSNLDNFYEGLRHFTPAERERIAVNHLTVRQTVLNLTQPNVVVMEEDSDDDDVHMRHAPSRKFRAASCRPRCVCPTPRAYYKNYCGCCHGWIPKNYH